MPLLKGKGAIGKNIAIEERAGKPPKVAEAIAFSQARKTGRGMVPPPHKKKG
jgi:hypothetical protein